MKDELKKEIFDEIFSNSMIGVQKCDCGLSVVFEKSGKRFPLKEVQPLLKDLLDKKLIKANKGLKEIVAM